MARRCHPTRLPALFAAAALAAGLFATVVTTSSWAGTGVLDPTFGSAGTVNTADQSDARAVVLQPDGKLVAAGTAETAVTSDFALARYSADGALDATFGIGGMVTTNFGDSKAEASALILQPDGKLVAAGDMTPRDTGDFDFALVRYTANGTLDPTFGTGGQVTTDFAGGSFDRAGALVLQPDGKLVAGGNTVTGAGSNLALARYQPDGTLDPRFGTGGKVSTDVAGRSAVAAALALQPDGRIVAAGTASAGNLDFALARYQVDGSLDPTFGDGGTVTTDFAGGTDEAAALVLQPDGKLVAAGDAETGGDTDAPVRDVALARYDTNGALDADFGRGGEVTTDFPGGFAEAYALVLQPDGKLVAAGDAASAEGGDSGSTAFALARYATGPVS
jgi:uncharacterized delta-60 repeat protein